MQEEDDTTIEPGTLLISKVEKKRLAKRKKAVSAMAKRADDLKRRGVVSYWSRADCLLLNCVARRVIPALTSLTSPLLSSVLSGLSQPHPTVHAAAEGATPTFSIWRCTQPILGT